MESISSGRWFYKEDNIRRGGIWVSAIRKRGKLYRNGARGRWYDERKLLYYLLRFKTLFNCRILVIFTDLPVGLFHLGMGDISNLVWEASGGAATIQLGEKDPFIWES